jgi:hypothetical protein
MRDMNATRPPVGRDTAEGAANGALFMALFGVIWAAAGAGALGGVAGIVLRVVYLVLAVVLCLSSVSARLAARSLLRDDSPHARARREHLSRRFLLVFGLEGLAIALAVVVLGRYDLVSFIPAVVALIVGIHFFPLARLYGVRAYHVTGAALCALALVTFFLAPAWRLPFVGLGSGLTLFATAAYVLSLVRIGR